MPLISDGLLTHTRGPLRPGSSDLENGCYHLCHCAFSPDARSVRCLCGAGVAEVDDMSADSPHTATTRESTVVCAKAATGLEFSECC